MFVRCRSIFPVGTDFAERHLIVLVLDVAIACGIVRIGEADQASRLHQDHVIEMMDMLGKRLAGRQVNVPDPHSFVLEHQALPYLLARFARHAASFHWGSFDHRQQAIRGLARSAR